ncbi:TylF/MycF family methyltransferase [Desulfovibrio sp. OttesenSCG-928-F20]|nr:TylF/MycF family methyltransferase [Desulfovibrio sp. OttesenSCG-928-F20]
MKSKTMIRIFSEALATESTQVKEEGIKKLYIWAVEALQSTPQNAELALHITIQAKKLGIPFQGIDHIRAMAFFCLERWQEAFQAVKEELRWFPDNVAARELLATIRERGWGDPDPTRRTDAFEEIYSAVYEYTMLSKARLCALHLNAESILRSGMKGNFVECGVAGGGSSGLLSWVLKKLAAPEVKLFCCDSFTGMPAPTEHDIHAGQDADSTGWGTGTCAAPESSVQAICSKVGTEDKIVIVKGYFEDTLPVWKDKIGAIAFLHMDGDWYSSTKAILDNLYDHLVPGAYVQIDDYGHWDGCRKAIHEFFDARNIALKLRQIDATGFSFTKPE